jgi:hypothetical protein
MEQNTRLITEIKESEKPLLQEIQFTEAFPEELVQPIKDATQVPLDEEENKKKRLLQER